MSTFSDDQIKVALNEKGIVKESFLKIQEACQILQEGTNCPDEDIDCLLKFLIGKWKSNSENF